MSKLLQESDRHMWQTFYNILGVAAVVIAAGGLVFTETAGLTDFI